jgi:hypothetical protein
MAPCVGRRSGSRWSVRAIEIERVRMFAEQAADALSTAAEVALDPEDGRKLIRFFLEDFLRTSIRPLRIPSRTTAQTPKVQAWLGFHRAQGILKQIRKEHMRDHDGALRAMRQHPWLSHYLHPEPGATRLARVLAGTGAAPKRMKPNESVWRWVAAEVFARRLGLRPRYFLDQIVDRQ